MVQKKSKRKKEDFRTSSKYRPSARIKPEEVKENMKKSVYWYITEKSREI